VQRARKSIMRLHEHPQSLRQIAAYFNKEQTPLHPKRRCIVDATWRNGGSEAPSTGSLRCPCQANHLPMRRGVVMNH